MDPRPRQRPPQGGRPPRDRRRRRRPRTGGGAARASGTSALAGESIVLETAGRSPSPPPASVVICVYNRATQVLGCLESLLHAGRDLEIVLVDDASTDATPSALARFRDAHPERRIVVVRTERNIGVSGARNAGVRVASGEFVLFTDSDCTVDPGWAGALVEALRVSRASAVSGVVEDAAPRTLAERAYVGSARAVPGDPRRSALIGCNMGFRRAVLARYGFDDAFGYGCDDHDLAVRLRAEGHRIAFAPQAIVRHDHPLTLRSYIALTYRQGLGSARFWYKHGMVGLDLLPLGAAIAVLPLAALDARLLLASLCLLLVELAGLAYIEAAVKAKPLWEALRILPICAVSALVRGGSVVCFLLRLAGGRERVIRQSRATWVTRLRSSRD